MTSLFVLPAPTRRNANVNANSTSTTAPPQQQQQQQQQRDLVVAYPQGNTHTPTTTRNNNNINRAPSYEQRCLAAAEFAKLTPAQRQSQSAKKLFVPRSILDFDDGGAFPEIHVAQYPKHMGNPHLLRQPQQQQQGELSSNVLNGGRRGNANRNSLDIVASSVSTTRALANVQIDASGNKDYTSLIKGGTNAQQKVYAHHSDVKGYKPSPDEVALPTQEQEAETASRTQAAINALLSDKIALSKPSGTALQNAATSQNQEEKTQFIEYTANPNAPGYNPAAAQRIIQMVPAQIDPMMPPKHKHLKAPPGPAEDFVPVLHAPPEKLTKEERMAWNIPACISNWKNARGYTIPLDKRLAADGRGLRDDSTINSNFATLSESLYLAERQAREEVRLRSLVQKRQAESERERRERELRELAMKARMDRGGVGVSGTLRGHEEDNEDDYDYVEDDSRQPQQQQRHDNVDDSAVVVPINQSEGGSEDDYNHDDNEDRYRRRNDSNVNVVEDEESRLELEKRERIRQERRKERERELRMERYKPKRGGAEEEEEEDVAIKKARLGDRDISEKIALGVHTGSGGGLGGGIDSRLYNQNAGLDSGFGADDEYATYTKPMFDREGVTSSSIYRPTRGEAAMDADEQYAKLKAGVTSRFQPDKGFSGAEGGRGAMASGPRNAPVQFEKGESK
eukprot:CAMPEP_0176499906 /NCGR_PEP_ID=MMETSP0200_2-20121128/13211_1 /TAXON_ID=947934 /ORGANISM="Chaetoceros sp., Strain GSL56" /LENGTH=680 /DNA_ID=CAMNT_0017898425 /DNA_START=221 /DNA_END=2263 /DNA_ORIENTATION=+